MVKITAPVTAAWARANARAAEQARLGRRAIPNGRGRYLVESSTGQARYEVRILNLGRLEYSCTCPCGQHPTGAGHCWHGAAALYAETVRVSRPAPTSGAAARMARFARP
jgi:uncharacterized Zn finger protein